MPQASLVPPWHGQPVGHLEFLIRKPWWGSTLWNWNGTCKHGSLARDRFRSHQYKFYLFYYADCQPFSIFLVHSFIFYDLILILMYNVYLWDSVIIEMYCFNLPEFQNFLLIERTIVRLLPYSTTNQYSFLILCNSFMKILKITMPRTINEHTWNIWIHLPTCQRLAC